MALIPLYEAKTYLRVDSSDEDALIGILLSSAEQMCKDVGRLSEDQWEAVNAADRDAENGVQPTRELEALRSTCRVAILYALGYLYEHRDEADHKQLMLTLRSILFAVSSCIVADDNRNLRVCDDSLVNRIQNRLQVRAAAGDENC